ncbi:putative bifunctional diguanylate cyclase/phosphodiesterase [Thaumasiovibrio sp. DFM-14]|uniref:putative bifunctional diguanylate cyclase/phosphodiesterase n=1 Tax=Thaumasiovibrio sp. DFM-14 TaxID=3384792 RepID=UPI0039A31E49
MTLKLINVCLVLAGLLLVFASITPAQKIQRQAPTLPFSLLTTLMLIFLFSYATQLGYLALKNDHLYLDFKLALFLFIGGTIIYTLLYVCQSATQFITKFQRQTQHYNDHDPLTGFPNRHHLLQQLDKKLKNAKSRHQELAILLIDFEDLKQVNNVLSHAAGDRLLEQLAEQITLYSPNSYIARVAGDEFAVVIDNSNEVDTARQGKQLATVLSETVRIEHTDISLSSHIGIAQYPIDGESAEQLLQHANIAMHYARQTRVSYIFYRLGMKAISNNNLDINAQLNSAFNTDQFVVFYHPLVYSHGYCLFGAEVLIRWRLPSGKILPASEVVPFAEQTPLMRQITRRVFTHAFKDFQRWRQQGHDFQLQLNISIRDLEDENFCNFIQTSLSDYALPPDKITLELTENIAFASCRQAQRAIISLHEIGVILSMDDFGTGQSSLALLAHVPFSQIKIDHSFIRNNTPQHQIIVETIQFIGKKFHVPVVAEGVETELHIKQAQSIGCEILQGYLFAEPMPTEQFEQWLNKSKRIAVDF